jgi:hypothetical protein
MLDLSSVRAKLSRSQENAQALKNEVKSWHDRNPYSVMQEANSDSTRYSVIIRINEPAQFQRWSLIFADAINNLRSSLDHLVYAIASYESAPHPPANESKLGFPIADCRANFDSQVSRGCLGTVSDPVRAAIEAAQPYNRGHETLPPVLGILRDLNNADKHRVPQLLYGTAYGGNVGFVGPEEFAPGNWKAEPFSGEIKDGAEIFAMTSDIPAPNMKFDRTLFYVAVAIRHRKREPSAPDWTDRTDIFALYSDIATEVRRTIYDVSRVVK